MSLLTKLGLSAPKVIATLAEPAATADSAESARPAEGVGADAAGPDTGMLNDATGYAQVLARARGELAGLGNDPSLAADRAKIQSDIDAARGLAKAGGYKGAASVLGQVNAKVSAALAKANAEYEKARDATQKLIDALDKHSQKARVDARIAAAKTKMATASTHAGKNEFDAASKLVDEAKVICVQAKALADQHEAFARKRADAQALIDSLTGLADATWVAARQAQLNQAIAKANAATPDFPGADALVEAVRSAVGDTVKAWYVTETKGRIQTLKAKPTAAYIAADLKLIDQLQAGIDAAVSSREWTKAVLGGRKLNRLLTPAEKLADRRIAYEDQRKLTDTALAPLKAKPAAKEILAALMLRYQAAEALASRASVHPEQGAAELARIAAECPQALQAADIAQAYAGQRADADAKLAKLAKSPAVDRLAEPLRVAREGLAAASASVAAAAKGTPLVHWQAARTQVERTLADLSAAESLAADLGPAGAAQAAAQGGAKDAAALKKAVADLRVAATAARAQKHADQAATAFKNVDDALKRADAALAAKDDAKAAQALAEAADAFAAAREVQNEHGRYDTASQALAARLKALEGLSEPDPKTIAARIDAVRKALADAKAKDNAHAGADAMAAVRAGEQAATVAEQAARDRAAFDKDAAETVLLVKPIADKKFQGELDQRLKDAVKQADAFKFDAAKATLQNIEVRIAAEKVKALAKTNPNDPEFAKAAKEMVAKGGAKALDGVIAGLPEAAGKGAIVTLAEARFGCKFDAGTNSDFAAMRQMCGALAKVPKDVVNNPSLKLVRHEKAGQNGGSYATDGGVVRINGRPGQSYQQFGPNLKNAEGKDQLKNVEPNCQPANNDPVDYMDFATLHEVGHAVDDANTFMASREGNAEFGGWRRYGGNLDPIADAVAKHHGFDKQYVLKKLQRLPAVAPPPPKGTSATDWTKKQAAVDKWYGIATGGGVWWRQAQCDEITIAGVIYQEAYAQDWVSYLAAARQKGMTGYQFRAPGEWFAEMYACFHSGKLKKTHPAAKWLGKLSV